MIIDAKVTAAAASLWRSQRREIVAAFGGDSMVPTIAPGEELKIQCGAAAKIGDVVFFLHDGRAIVHRVVAINRRGLWTHGDANLLPDGYIAAGDVIGVVTSVSRGGEWRAIAPAQRRVVATLLSLAARAGGFGVVSMLWRARSAAARTARRLLRASRGDGRDASRDRW
jgi:signal peptidase I